MENIISLKKIDKYYDNIPILTKINLNISKGEIFGLLGPSGAGKTTILKIITGQTEASAGEVIVMGKNVKQLKDNVFLNIGMVLDNIGLYERLNAYENLYIFSKLTGVGKERIYQVLEQVELKDDMKKSVSSFSKGMKQRLAIARAILHNPQILFLDEPISGLDPVTAEKIHEMLLNLKKNGTTIFLTTHNMDEAYKICDNIAMLFAGEIIEYGRPEDICRNYNVDNNIRISLHGGRQIILENTIQNAEKIYEILKDGNLNSIHSSEPDLGRVFIHLTGKELV